METGLIVLWIALGLISVLLVTQGGLRQARETLHAESRFGRLALQAAMVLTFAFGLAVPGLVLIFNGEDKASVIAGSSVRATAVAQQGRVLFTETCAYCHTLQAASAVGRTGPNLDKLVPVAGDSIKARKALVLGAIASGFAGSQGQMPPAIYSGSEADAVAEFVALAAGR